MYKAIIIDDEKWVVKSLLATISNQDLFEITGEFYNGTDGFAYMRECTPDLAFIDVQLADMNGLELLSAAQQMGLKTLFIVISGHAEFAYAQRALFHNAIGYCLKPFSRNELLDSMQKAYDILEERGVDSTSCAETAAEAVPVDFIPERLLVHNKTVQAMVDYTCAHFCEDISIQTLALQNAVNANYASQIFKQETGKNFSSYLTDLRIGYALWLLANTDMPVSLISSQIGYRDYFYFAKVFKKQVQVTPTSYRNQLLKQEDGCHE